MVALVTCKNERDPIKKNEGTRVLTSLYVEFSHAQGQPNSAVTGDIQSKFELIQAFVVGLVTCKNKEDLIKKEGARVLTTILPL